MQRRIAVCVVAAVFAVACSQSPKSRTTASSSVASPTTVTSITVSPATSSETATTASGTSATPATAANPGYSANITRTTYGIPHIVADDWGSLGFGQGYAFAQDRACTLIDQVIKVRGERSKWFGPGDGDANLNTDFAYRQLGLHATADKRFANQPPNVADMIKGYVAGFNAELAAQGPHGWCEGKPWVQPITTTDVYAYLNDVLLFASSGVLIQPIATAQPPQAAPPDTIAASADASTGSIAAAPSKFNLKTTMASNGWAIGASLSERGGGMLLSNPHFPWEGEKRLWESQLTLTTGELNVYGVSLSGVPGVLIGFNDNVAWTHTVSAGYRMTLYELTLTPGDPTSFVYGNTTEKMTSKDVTIDVMQADGTTKPQTRTMWSSHYGPLLNLPFGWTTEKAYTMRDANIDNPDALAQFFGMDAAKSMDDFINVHRTANGIPWVNTIATSSDGRAWYADTAATPNLSPAALAVWKANVDSGALAKTVLDNGAILLDGSDPVNEWVDDPAATRPGILAFAKQPQLERSDFVFNSNDSHWLANPAQLLTGYSPLTGPEVVPQSPRTRMNAMLLADPAVRGADGRISLAEMEGALFSNRGLHSDLLLKSVIQACDATPSATIDETPYALADACGVLRNWDGRYNLDSKGAPLWREFLGRFKTRTDAGDLYAVPFEPTDPVGTPNTLNADTASVLTKLATAAKALLAAGHPIESALGEMQFDGRAGSDRTPLPGGQNLDGAASIVACCSGAKTLAPKGDPGTSNTADGFTTLGYPVSTGDSFIMAMEFTSGGPHAEALLTYGQPDDPASPDFTSQTKLFAKGTFRPVLFTPDQIKAGAISTATVTGRRG